MARCADDQRMVAGQLVRVVNAAGMGNHFYFIAHGLDKFAHPLRLVFRVKATLQALVMGGDAGGASVLIAA